MSLLQLTRTKKYFDPIIGKKRRGRGENWRKKGYKLTMRNDVKTPPISLIKSEDSEKKSKK